MSDCLVDSCVSAGGVDHRSMLPSTIPAVSPLFVRVSYSSPVSQRAACPGPEGGLKSICSGHDRAAVDDHEQLLAHGWMPADAPARSQLSQRYVRFTGGEACDRECLAAEMIDIPRTCVVEFDDPHKRTLRGQLPR